MQAIDLNFQVFELDDEFDKIPSCSGVYLIQDRQSKVIYVGMSKNLKNRIYNHKMKKWFPMRGYAVQACALPYEECRNAERWLIRHNTPALNKSRI